MNIAADQLLTYSKKINDHSFDVLLGYSMQEETAKSLTATGNQFPNDIVVFGCSSKKECRMCFMGY